MQRRDFLRFFSKLAVLGVPKAVSAAPGRLSDLMPRFWRTYDISRQTQLSDRVAALAADFFLPEAESYSAAGFNGAGSHGRLLDDRVAEWLARLDGMAAPVRAIATALPAAWREHDLRFRSAGLVQVRGAEAIFLPSLFSFTGYSRIWNEIPMLFLAPDGIVDQIGERPDLAVLLDHEAFHVYHDVEAPDLRGPSLWIRIWREGLATYVSERLNPSASLDQVLMSAELPRIGSSQMASAARYALAKLDDGENSGLLFDARRHEGFAARMGYLLGLTVAKAMTSEMPIDAAARLSAANVHPRLVDALSKLAGEA